MQPIGHNGSAHDTAGNAADYVRAAPPLVQESPPARRADQRLAAPDAGRPAAPLRVGFVVGTFTFGGSETETIELIYGADPRRLSFTGIAVKLALPLPPGEPPRDGSFPPIYSTGGPKIELSDPRIRIVATFDDAVRRVLGQSDIILTWGVHDLQDHLPEGALPPLVVVSKDSGQWARSFLHPNSLLARHCVGNSTLAAGAFPERMQRYVKVIHDGINPRRIAAKVSRNEQRKAWGLRPDDRVVGYLGRIEADKGVSKTVEGVARLPAHWKAVFIGANPNCRYVRQLEEHCETAIPGRYRLLGWCHDVGSALAAMDVFCQPSEHEGFSNSLGEAWLAGIPTVYTRGTGALPDLGELGISVSAAAGGREMAQAIAGAYGNSEMVRRARAIIEANYLVAHNVRRWTEYLVDAYRQRRRTRVLAVIPDALVDQAYTWLISACDGCVGLDLCGVLVAGEANARHSATLARLENWHACPVWTTDSLADVELAIRYTRPGVVLAWSAPSLWHVLPRGMEVAVVDAARLGTLDALAAPPAADGWLMQLANTGRHVHAKD